MSRTVLVPADRVERWFHNFSERHGAPALDVVGGRLRARAQDGSVAEAALPLGRPYDGPPDVAAFADVRPRAGALGRAAGPQGRLRRRHLRRRRAVVASKVGQRHVQGRTKAGGQSQQRFARRRDNQARQAYEAAAEHAHRILVLESRAPVTALVCGGDRAAVDQVLADPRLRRLGDAARRTRGSRSPTRAGRCSTRPSATGCLSAVEITDPDAPAGSAQGTSVPK